MIPNQTDSLTSLNNFFSALNYQDGDKVCFQYLAPEGNNEKLFKKNQLTMTYPLKSIPIHREPFRIFYIVNGQGFLSADIKKCLAIFCEFDDLPLDSQKTFWQKNCLPEPTMQVYTGGKSIHHYWVFNAPLEDVLAWEKLMNDLIKLCGSDKAIKNRNRLLRPPTFNYCDKLGKFNGQVTTIISNSGKRYSYLTLRNAITSDEEFKINQQIKNELSDEQIRQLINDIIPLIPTKPKGDYDSYRTFLTAIKNIISEDFAIDLAVNNLCKFSNDNWTQIIQSSHGNFNLGTIIKFANLHGFDYRDWLQKNGNSPKFKFNLKQNTNYQQNLEKTYQNSSPEVNELDTYKLLEQLVNKLAQSEVTQADRSLEIAKFTSLHRISSGIIERAINERLKRDDQGLEIDSIKSNLDDLIKVPDEQLNLNYILTDFLAILIQESAQQIPTNPDAVVTIFLPVLASIIGTRSRIIVNPNSRYIIPFIIRSMIVGRSGNKKSPTARLAVDALQELNIQAYKQYKQELKDWENSAENQPKPVLKRYIVQDSTLDGLIKAHAENPQGFLCFVDELSGYFKRMNKFYNGDDLQRDLELYEGKPLIKTRATEDNNIFLEKTAISITGTIQEIALREILNSRDDLTGVSARWIIWAGKMPLGKLPVRNKDEWSFTDIVSNIITELLHPSDFSIGDLLISDDGYEVFRAWQHEIMDKIVTLSLPQLENKYSKIESDVIKFAGILHYLHLLFGTGFVNNPSVINSEIMKRAISLGNYYLRHFAYIVTKCQDNLLDAQMLKILELVKKKDSISGVDVKRFIWEFKKTPSNEINDLLLSLVELGKVEQMPTKKGIKVKLL